MTVTISPIYAITTGATWRLRVECKDNDGEPLSLTDAVAWAALKVSADVDDDDAAILLNSTDDAAQVAVEASETGVIQLTLYPSNTATLTPGTEYRLLVKVKRSEIEVEDIDVGRVAVRRGGIEAS